MNRREHWQKRGNRYSSRRKRGHGEKQGPSRESGGRKILKEAGGRMNLAEKESCPII